jgi:molybdopterin synthase sulfur carrier subunit
MRIAFYGRLAEAIAPEIDVEADRCTVADLRERLAGDYPGAAATLRSVRARACVDDAVVPDDHVLHAGDRVEFLPPVSGG